MVRLQKIADGTRLDYVKILTDDALFNYCTINVLKRLGDTTLKTLKIILVQPIQRVEDINKREELLKLHHNDNMYGGHKGKKKLYAELKSAYYWKNMC